MYLEKLEIQGFKSFANKNSLLFPGLLNKDQMGITVIVGPNGSGKSNIADAVRWVLGEQSMKTLRGKKSKDIIFSGSTKLGRGSMAEVSLFLNNKNRKAPIDYSQIVLTRRLFRDGNSEYLLNNSRVRLSDVQILLAKAKFGQKTYSVIGQGMVEGFLNTSLTERKEFFDEATGVKQFQIKRDESLNKLKLSYDNLTQAQMLLSEIEPRLKSLTRQVAKLQKREKIEIELKELQLNYYRKIWHEINDKFNEFNKNFLNIEKEKITKEKKMTALNQKIAQMEAADKTNQKFDEWQKKLSDLQIHKDNITKQLAKLDARIEIQLEKNGRFDLSWLNNKKVEIAKEIEKLNSEIAAARKNIQNEEENSKKLEKRKNDINAKINNLNNNLMQTGGPTDGLKTKKINSSIKNLLVFLNKTGETTDINQIKAAIKKIKQELNKILELSEKDKPSESEIKKIQSNLTELTQNQEKIVARLNKNNIALSVELAKIKLWGNKSRQLLTELHNINNKLKQARGKTEQDSIENEKNRLKSSLAAINQNIVEIQEKINTFSREEEEKRSALFELQKNIQNLQDEINKLNSPLNELKVNSVKYETKLEDLEIEIRQALGTLKEIKSERIKGDVDAFAELEKINSLKKQLDMIGQLDPEIEKEYIDTKERFDFLSGQISDLDAAINSLEKIIKELDITIKEKFDKEFKVISQKFEEYFKILFNGGQAKVIKVLAGEENEDKKNKKESEAEIKNNTEDKNAAEAEIGIKKIKFLQKHNATGLAGVEIQATPPNKKIKTVTMLSGGERALTAIALICAIISANPSPFVVLDEVDAALDEANSERLSKILDDLSHKTQFIVITHNRATMRRANILYGITMRDDGVSKLLSIKLDEAEARS